MVLPAFYTPCYVEVKSRSLSQAWLGVGGLCVVWAIISLFGNHQYTEKFAPKVDVKFWQDYAVDGKWWYESEWPAAYCDTMAFSDGDSWADDTIGCKRPAATPSTYFYTLPNEVRVATSIAYARGYTPAEDELGASSFDPMYNSSSIWTYESIEKSTLVLEPSFSTARSVVSHVPHCKVFDRDGLEIVSHYDRLYPERDYGDGYLMLSLEDILRAAGHEMDDTGGERAPLRLAGLELVALVDIQNYHVPFRWPSGTFNPFGVPVAGEIECSVRFEVLRNQFTPVQWFYDRERPVALQHGLRIVVLGTGSVGYFAVGQLLSQLLLSVLSFTAAQSLLDAAWYWLFPKSLGKDAIVKHAWETRSLDLDANDEGIVKEAMKALARARKSDHGGRVEQQTSSSNRGGKAKKSQ